jgi:hypothetical protein
VVGRKNWLFSGNVEGARVKRHHLHLDRDRQGQWAGTLLVSAAPL